jgi:hypothetical protein
MFQYARKIAAVYPDNCSYHMFTINSWKNFLHKRKPRRILYCERVEPRTNSYEVGQSCAYKSHIDLSSEGDGREFQKIHSIESELYNN